MAVFCYKYEFYGVLSEMTEPHLPADEYWDWILAFMDFAFLQRDMIFQRLLATTMRAEDFYISR